MSHPADIPKPELLEMISAHAGIVTAILAKDQPAADQQLKSIVDEHIAASGGDVTVFAFRMLKQLEAGARHDAMVVKTLAKRAGLGTDQAHELMAQMWREPDIFGS